MSELNFNIPYASIFDYNTTKNISVQIDVNKYDFKSFDKFYKYDKDLYGFESLYSTSGMTLNISKIYFNNEYMAIDNIYNREDLDLYNELYNSISIIDSTETYESYFNKIINTKNIYDVIRYISLPSPLFKSLETNSENNVATNLYDTTYCKYIYRAKEVNTIGTTLISENKYLLNTKVGVFSVRASSVPSATIEVRHVEIPLKCVKVSSNHYIFEYPYYLFINTDPNLITNVYVYCNDKNLQIKANFLKNDYYLEKIANSTELLNSTYIDF